MVQKNIGEIINCFVLFFFGPYGSKGGLYKRP